MKQFGPLPRDLVLAPTLAQRVSQLREVHNLTVLDVAQSARFTPRRVEEIEAGMETWLSVTERQRLAKALNVDPRVLKEVEVQSTRSVPESHMFDQNTSTILREAILGGARELTCPDCGNSLKCSVQEGRDLEEQTIRFAKAFCVKCPFVLRN
jgi:transcriptional regulator with XRE-family HTH domain